MSWSRAHIAHASSILGKRAGDCYRVLVNQRENLRWARLTAAVQLALTAVMIAFLLAMIAFATLLMTAGPD